MLKDLVIGNRSYRRFKQHARIQRETLLELLELARLSPSGGNKQALKYALSCDPERNALIFRHLAWAAYLKDWPGPAEGERPSAYIVILSDAAISREVGCDHGIAAQTIMLGAAEKGLGGCMIGSVDRKALRASLDLPDRYDILLVLALGEPAEEVRIEDIGAPGDIKYWRSADGVHHVPKRALGDLLVEQP